MLTGEVAARMHITSGTVTSLLDNLEQKKYVVRSSDREDRRRVLVDITPPAHAVLDEALPEIQQVTRLLTDRIGPERQQLLLDILRNGEDQEAALAAFALGLRGEDESRVDLESALLEGDRPNPVTFIHALQDLGRPAALPALRSYLEFRLRSDVRAAADLAVTVLKRVEASTR